MTAWLLTWLWQGSALAAVVALALRCAPRWNAATRHLVWCAALAAVAGLGWVSSPYGGLTPVQVRGSDPIYVPSAPDFVLSIFVGIWAAIALVNLLRVLPRLRGVYAVRDRCRPFPSNIESRLPLWLEAKESGRRTELMICDVVPGATVLGFHRPCIAIPSSLIEALTSDELDQVILHEHAHVQRRDDWLRLAQTLLLSVLWVHPAALFASRALSREREMACDEWVVARTGLPKAYARCLAHAAEVRMRMRGGPTLIPALIGSRHELVRRVDRVLAIKNDARRSVSIAGTAAAACAIVMISVQLQGVRFAEMANVMFPHVTGPIMSIYEGATVALVQGPITAQPDPAVVRLKPDTTFDAPIAPTAPGPVAPIAPIASSAPIETLNARLFQPSYDRSLVEPTPTDKPNRWQAIASPGVGIASAAKKTSVGIANIFSHAGVSLARSF